MQSALIWTAIIAFSLFRYRQRRPDLPAPIFRRHAFFSWLLLILNHTAFKNFGWALANPGSIKTEFFKPMGILPAEANFAVWLVWSVLGVAAMVIALSLASGSPRSRVLTVSLAPLFGLVFAADFVRYATEPPSPEPWLNVTMVALAVVAAALSYGLMWRFYRQPDVVAAVFAKAQPSAA